MTQEEFDFWQRAYLAALQGTASIPNSNSHDDTDYARMVADDALRDYRAAKATVVQTTYATGD